MASENKEQSLISEGAVDKLSETLVSLAKSIGFPTIIAALFYYLGLARVQAIYAHFGIDQSILKFTMQDYLVKSVIASFEPIRWVLVLGFAGLWINYWIGNSITAINQDRADAKAGDQNKNKIKRLQWLVRFILIAGIIALLTGLFFVLSGRAFNPFIVTSSWMLGVGLLSYCAYLGIKLRKALDESGAPKSWLSDVPEVVLKTSSTIIIILLIFSAFWFISFYAQVIGDWEAGYLVKNIKNVPCVEIYSQKPLNLIGQDITFEQVSTEENAYQYHYSGLRFLLYSSSKYFLLPMNWSRQDPRAIIIEDNENVRVEVAPGYYCTQ